MRSLLASMWNMKMPPRKSTQSTKKCLLAPDLVIIYFTTFLQLIELIYTEPDNYNFLYYLIKCKIKSVIQCTVLCNKIVYIYI